MPRPKIIWDMHTLLNGKIDGIANPTDIGMRSQKPYFDLMLGRDRYYFQHRCGISGTWTSRAFLGDVFDVELPEPTEPVPARDYIADPDATMHYFAVDRKGSLKWDRSAINYFDVEAHIVELIPNSVSDAFKAHLRSVGVSYLIAGDDEIDMDEAARKIGEIFHTEEIILGGGGPWTGRCYGKASAMSSA